MLIALMLLGLAAATPVSVSQTELVIDCWDKRCPSSWKGDSICDWDCMNPMCNYDSSDSSSGTWQDRFWYSDCRDTCLSNENCQFSMLGNGNCDSACNFQNCGFDLGDCSYCADGCTVDKLTNNQDDTECNTDMCRFDNNQFGWCTEGCKKEELDNDECDSNCNVPDCDFDNNNCEIEECAEGCPNHWIGDGFCDSTCYNADCQYDSPDCQCSDECPPSLMEEPCSSDYSIGYFEACDTLDCDFKNGKCGDCYSGCFNSDIGNGVCDEQCNNELCNYDSKDCGCYPGCELTYDPTSEVWSTNGGDPCVNGCMNIDCEYAFYTGGCTDTQKIEFSMLNHIISDDDYAEYDQSFCMVNGCDSDKIDEILTNQSCNTDVYDYSSECGSPECLYCFGFMYENSAENCNFGNEGGDECFRCKYKQIGKTCLDENEECPTGYKSYAFTSGLDNCVKKLDASSEEDPAIIYVDSSSSSTGDGSSGSPYSSLAMAFANVYQNYTVINLSAGVHYYTLDESISNRFIDDKTNPLYRNHEDMQKMITIEGNNDAEIRLFNQTRMQIQGKTEVLKIQNLKINGEEFLVPSCSEDYCKYCQYAESVGGVLFDDRNQQISNSIPENCADFHDYNFIIVDENTSLQVENVEFSQIRFTPLSVIHSAGDVSLKNTNFTNIQTFEQGSIVYINTVGLLPSFTYEVGTVSYLNNGFEVGVSMSFTGFLYMNQGFNAQIKDVNFEKIFIYNAQESNIYLGLMVFQKLQGTTNIERCMFNTAFSDFFIVFDANDLVYADYRVDEDDISQSYSQIHVSMKDNEFRNIAATSTIIYYSMNNILQNINLENNTFENIVAYNGVIYINYSGVMTSTETEGGTAKVLMSSGTTQTITIPKRTTSLKKLKLSKINFNDFIISLTNLANNALDEINYADSGDEYENYVNDAIVSLFIEDTDSYVSNPVDTSIFKTNQCLKSVYLNYMNPLNITVFEFSNITCSEASTGSPGIYVNGPIGENHYLNNITVNNIRGGLGEGIAMIIENGDNFEFNHLTISDVQDISMAGVYINNVKTVRVQHAWVENFNSLYKSPLNLNMVSDFYLSDSTFKDTEILYGSGGALTYLASVSNLESPTFSILNSTFENNKATSGKGGSLYIRSEASTNTIEFNITNLVFTESNSYYGAAIYIEDTVSVSNGTVNTCTFQESYSGYGGVIDDNHYLGEITYKNLHFSRNTGAYCGVYGYYGSWDWMTLNMENSNFTNNDCTYGVNIASSKGGGFEFTDLIFNSNTGTGITIMAGDGILTNCDFNNSEEAILISSSGTADIKDSKFEFCVDTVSAEDNAYFSCDNCQFYNNTGGNIQFSKDSWADISNSQFIDNKSTDSASVITSSASSTQNVTITSSNFASNSGDAGTIFALNSNIVLIDCDFNENRAVDITPGIYAALGSVYIYRSRFSNQEGITGGFLYVSSGSAFIYESVFTNGRAVTGGAIYMIVGSLFIYDSDFYNMIGTSSGGVIQGGSLVNLYITRCYFSNSESELGGVINQITGTINIEDSQFYTAKISAIYSEQVSEVTIKNSVFQDTIGDFGSALYCIESDQILIEGSTFTNGSANELGGAIYIEALTSFDDKETYSLVSTTITKSSAISGGGLLSSNALLEITNCNFSENTATRDGGAAYITCGQNTACTTTISGSTFTTNTATASGGSIKWEDRYPTITSTTFLDNSAFYGNDVASYAIALKEVTERRLSLTDIAPGQVTTQPLVLALVDQYDNIYTIDNESTASLITYDNDLSLSGTTKVTAVEGIYTFDSFIVGFFPGENVDIGIVSDGINESLKESSGDTNTYLPEISIEVQLRPCEPGEEDTGKSCNICLPGMYSLEPSNLCQDCKDEAECPGGWEMFPKATYWRSSNATDTFYKCPNPDACTGNNENTDYIGACEAGYTGNMCQSCKIGYSRSTENTCAKCPDEWANILRLLGVAFGGIIFFVFLVKSSLNSAYQPKAIHSIYLKIMMNYIQLVYLTTQFNLAWPDFVIEMFNLQKSTATVSDQIFSFDCFLEGHYDSDNYQSVYFTKIIIFSVLPLLVLVGTVAVWGTIALVTKKYILLKREMVACFIVLFFFLHPTVSKALFSTFSCREIEDYGLWLLDNLEVECWVDEHYYYTLYLALPALLLWGFGVPAFILIFMYKSRKTLYSMKNRLRFGFLVNGYRPKRFYWEFVILYRKMLIICLAVFLSTISIPIQALTALFLLMISLYLHTRLYPFSMRHLNNMETTAILVATVTIYCGLYYLTEDLDETSKIMFFFVMVFLNLLFIGYWLYHMTKHLASVLAMKIPFIRKRVYKADGLTEKYLIDPQINSFSYRDREKHVFTFIDQNKDNITLEEDEFALEYPSMASLYLANVRGIINKQEEPSIIIDDD